jgi:sterol 3beta-glucosyltransferase
MRALLLTVGSQGDVQPFVALAARLRAAGHEAVLAAPAIYQGLAGSAGVAAGSAGVTAGSAGDAAGSAGDAAGSAGVAMFVPLDLDMAAVGQAVAGKHGIRHALAFAKAMGERAAGILPTVSQAAAAQRPDVVVHHPVLPVGQHIAEMHGVPAVVAPPLPALVPTGEFLSPAWPFAHRLPGTASKLNRVSYQAARYLAGAWCRRDVDAWRRGTLCLADRPGRHDPLRPEGVTTLHSFSEHVVPRPADWPATAHITGYWFLEASGNWTPPRRLAEFLDAGEPPVYLGFGSMPHDDPARLAEVIDDVAARTSARFVVYSLSPELRRRITSKTTLVIRQVPHDWLFPRTAAVVHHGGAGTTGGAVAAGRPQVILPFGIDQHFWADRMIKLGVAVPAAPVAAMAAAKLASAVDQARNDQLIEDRAQLLARRVQAEDGTGQAVAHLERLTTGKTSGKTSIKTSPKVPA